MLGQELIHVPVVPPGLTVNVMLTILSYVPAYAAFFHGEAYLRRTYSVIVPYIFQAVIPGGKTSCMNITFQIALRRPFDPIPSLPHFHRLRLSVCRIQDLLTRPLRFVMAIV